MGRCRNCGCYRTKHNKSKCDNFVEDNEHRIKTQLELFDNMTNHIYKKSKKE